MTEPTTGPAFTDGAMNYWNPSGAELLEFLRSGDPKWVWDFALPQSWLQMFSAYLNVGSQTHSSLNGLAVNSGGTGEGQWHRYRHLWSMGCVVRLSLHGRRHRRGNVYVAGDGTELLTHNKFHTAAILLMAHELDPSLSLCEIVKTIMDDPAFSNLWLDVQFNDAGWWKATDQMMQGSVFGVGIYDVCSDPP